MFEEFTAEFPLKPTGTHPKRPSDTVFPTVVPDPPIFQHATAVGHRTFWVLFVAMLVVLIAFIGLSWRVPAAKRLYHSLTTVVILVSTLVYFALATGSGWTFHHVVAKQHHKGDIPDTHRQVFRQVYWVRYLDWLITTPILLVDLSLVAGLNGASIFSAGVSTITFILTGLFAALSRRKATTWGWYTISIISYLWVVYTLIVTGRATARAKGVNNSRFYTQIATYSVIVWLVYPIIWALSENTRTLSVDGEIIAYAVLDVLAKAVFGIWLLFTHGRVPESHADLEGFWSHGLDAQGRIRISEDGEGA